MDIKEISSPFRLLQHNILEFKFENKTDVRVEHNNIERMCDTDYNIVHNQPQEDHHFGVVELFITTKRIVDDNEEFNTFLRLNGLFIASSDMPKDIFDRMLEYNGVAALYGIARGNITSLSSLCYPAEPIVLPMANINALVKKHHNTNRAEE